ncbi:MAG: iron ABC transporter substrate-binding protein, partial [Dehalococcoidia bacterium]|nr:iron ABC transporter substrate-binding protein [Dehalococcoidia bacterium]
MRKMCGLIGTILLAWVLLASCSPGDSAVSTPVVTPAALAKSTSSPTSSNLPPPTSQDAAWDKIIEAAKKEGRVSVYSFNMTGDAGLAVTRAFEAKYGVKLDIITGGGAALAERIKTEKRMGTIVADVMDA